MDEISLSLKLKRLTVWLDSRCQPDSGVRKQFDGAPFGSCYVTVDPIRQDPAASRNLNRVYLCGTEAGLQPEGLDRLIELFTAAGVRRFFVWLSPGPDMDRVRGWLKERGLSRPRWTAYPTLIAARVERAEQIGCPVLVSETLTMLEHSLRNLRRAGFREVYDKEVYEWNA
jgi:hypothetical protein